MNRRIFLRAYNQKIPREATYLANLGLALVRYGVNGFAAKFGSPAGKLPNSFYRLDLVR